MNILKKTIYRIICLFKFIYFKIFNWSLFKIYINKWFLFDWDESYLINHNLTENSIVFEVWWYTWVFSDKLIKKYNPLIYIFEPIEDFYNILINKYKNNPRIKIYKFWLSNKNEIIKIYKSGDWSSIYKQNWIWEQIQLIDIKDFIISEKLEHANIDLISINIEWGEYVLIERILENFPKIFKSFQVQFHDFVKDADNKRNNILKLFEQKWYKKWYSFPFVWEYFEKNKIIWLLKK